MTVQVEKISNEGKQAGTLPLDEKVYGITPNEHLIYLAVKRELANARSGSANSKTRSEVSGGGRKPWRQKGTGRARAGSIRSPLWRGGGVTFGPKPRSFDIKLTKKMRRGAIRSVLSLAAQEGRLHAIADFSFLDSHKTKPLNTFLVGLGVKGQKVLVLADYRLEVNQNLKLAARNIPEVKLRLPMDLSVKDLLQADYILATEQALEEIKERFGPNVANESQAK